jgi:ribosome-binding ATPase
MQTGIIGLPQSGKTTLFRILTHAHLDEKAARAATHVGIARVPEPRLAQLAAIYHPPKITYATVEYVDVGGISRDRKRDSSVLAPLREVDALAHVLRVFDDPSVPHAAGSVDPLRDAVSLDLELMLSDLDQIERRIERVEKDLKRKKETGLEFELALLQRCRAAIQAETPLRELPFSPEEKKGLTGFMFLSARPMLYVLNLGDDEAPQLDSAAQRHGLEKLVGRPATAGRPQSAIVAVCGRIEAELAELEDAAAAELLAAYGLKEPGLHRLIRATYDLLGLIQFFTAGEPEVRAWTIARGTTAVKAAGVIHTDIERGFIRAEVVRCEDLLAAGSIPAAREKGQVRLEGKEYVVQEGDVILFRHSG